MVTENTVTQLLREIGLESRVVDGMVRFYADDNLRFYDGKKVFCEATIRPPKRGYTDDSLCKKLDAFLASIGYYFEVYDYGVYILASISEARVLGEQP